MHKTLESKEQKSMAKGPQWIVPATGVIQPISVLRTVPKRTPLHVMNAVVQGECLRAKHGDAI